MLFVFNLLFVIIAIAMIILVLMQRGAGASAGSGFGGGASATVFGARGSSNFLSKATKWLAISFFSITLFMAWYAMHRANPNALDMDLGVMGAQQQAPAVPAVPQGDAAVPAAPAASGAVLQTPADAATVPSAPAQEPAPQAPQTE